MKINALRDGGVALCFLVLMALIAVKVEEDAGETFTGAYRVADGDSLVHEGKRLRLLGIDAPELHQSCSRAGAAWNCGEAARTVLADLVQRGQAECRGSRQDKYGRLLVTCRKGDLDINREMVRRGMAVAFGDYDADESEARAARAGLWASDFARPSDWRRSHNAGLEETPHSPSFFRRLARLE